MRDPTILDNALAKHNPWGLTPHQCMVMRLHCKLGNVKAIWAEIDMPIKSVHWHLENIRNTMGIPGRDVRIFLQFDRWMHQYMTKQRAT
jgi:hypothetical protein